ncbi:MAG: molybdopterin-dependent oxidoreductase [Actinophytocola sp.]|nr:molybdopterin-dependent oxidoreductase [Actinophytocola sp.]
MLHAAALRSPYPHARIVRVDAERARRQPGVLAVVTGADPAAQRTYGWYIKDQPILAGDKARYAGDIVSAVAAEDPATAMAAVELIDVDYEPLEPLSDVESALRGDAPALFEERPAGTTPRYGRGASGWIHPDKNVCYRFRYHTGDATVMSSCDHVFDDSFSFSAMQHYHLEPFVSLASVTDGVIDVWSSNQSPFSLRRELARLFDRDEDRVRVHVPLVGGAFGAKNGCKAEPVAILLAMQTGRPVRFCMTAAEGFLTQRQHSATLRLRTGVMADGTLIGRDCEVLLDAGAYADASPLVAEKAAYRAPGPYRWQYVDAAASCVLTTTTPAGPFRGFGAPQAAWASESQLDMIAHRLGIDPYDLRVKNLRELGEPYMPGDSAVDSDLRSGLAAVAEALHYHDRPRREALRTQGRGLGLAIGFKDSGGGSKPASARVTVDGDGHVTLRCGTVELGQGAHTALRQIAAEILGIPVDGIDYAPVDTASVPFDQGTYASSSSAVMARAVAEAAIDVRRQVRQALTHRDGKALGDRGRHEDHALPQDWRRLLAGQVFDASGHFEVTPDADAPLGEKCFFWEPGWGGAEVEVDSETGRVRVRRLVVCGDAGRMINPELCHGQESGSAIMGLAQALVEHRMYAHGALATHDPLSYRVTTFTDLPDELDLMVQEQGHGPGPFGAKGYGEGGMLVVAAAIANAVQDAVGARVTDLPLTPERVLHALDQGGSEPSAGAAG